MNPFNTKAIFSWNIPAFQGGDPNKFADGLADAGFEIAKSLSTRTGLLGAADHARLAIQLARPVYQALW